MAALVVLYTTGNVVSEDKMGYKLIFVEKIYSPVFNDDKALEI